MSDELESERTAHAATREELRRAREALRRISLRAWTNEYTPERGGFRRCAVCHSASDGTGAIAHVYSDCIGAIVEEFHGAAPAAPSSWEPSPAVSGAALTDPTLSACIEAARASGRSYLDALELAAVEQVMQAHHLRIALTRKAEAEIAPMVLVNPASPSTEAAVRAGIEAAVEDALKRAKRNETCAPGCRCADGYHIADGIRRIDAAAIAARLEGRVSREMNCTS